jgi:hypothetical protein
MNMGIIILIVVAALWGLGIFFGAIGGLSKVFTRTPTAVDSSSTKDRQEQFIDDTQQKQKQMMDDLKQKMEDARQNQ